MKKAFILSFLILSKSLFSQNAKENNNEYDPYDWFKWTKEEESRRKY